MNDIPMLMSVSPAIPGLTLTGKHRDGGVETVPVVAFGVDSDGDALVMVIGRSGAGGFLVPFFVEFDGRVELKMR